MLRGPWPEVDCAARHCSGALVTAPGPLGTAAPVAGNTNMQLSFGSYSYGFLALDALSHLIFRAFLLWWSTVWSQSRTAERETIECPPCECWNFVWGDLWVLVPTQMRVDQSGQILDKSPWHDHRASHCLTRAGLICPGLSAELLLLYLQPDHTTAWPRLLLLWQRLFHTAAGPRSWHWVFCPPISVITLITTTLICGPHPSAAVMPVLYQGSVLPLLVALGAEIICNMRNAPWTRDTRGQGGRCRAATSIMFSQNQAELE